MRNWQGNGVRTTDSVIHSIEDGVDRVEKRRKFILDPRKPFIGTWNKIIVLSCVIAVSLDPLFFYIPVIKEEKKCLRLDKKLYTTAIVLRSVTDIIYIMHIILQFRTGFIDKASERRGKPILITDAWKVAKRYLWPYFLIDILAVLPIPQVLVSIIFSEMRGSGSLDSRKLLNSAILFQYVPRILRIYLSCKELMRTASKLTKTVWVRAAFNLFLYFIASHVLGAFWYLFSIERETACWQVACENHVGCVRSSFSCDDKFGDRTFLNDFCPFKEPNTTLFNFGIFLDALQSGIVESTDFPQKLSHCFWWGLRNLSSLGQNLQTSSYIWESCFAISISVFGLLLLLYFIGNLQTYMQLSTTRSEEVRMKMKLKERDIELWVSNNELTDNIKKRIMQTVQNRLEENRDVSVENLLPNLPVELKKDVKLHLCLDVLKKVPMLQNMGEQLLPMICEYLKAVHYSEHNYIVREGDPLDAMIFITQGIAWSYRTHNGSLRVECLEKGHFYGEELLVWGFNASPLPNLTELPSSTKTVRSHTKVEGFALMANDLKTIVSRWHPRKEIHDSTTADSKLKASVVVQAAWRRHLQEKEAKGNRNSPRAVISPRVIRGSSIIKHNKRISH